jgi:hypothetical protein
MTTNISLKIQAKKPSGGFRFLTVQQLCLVWWAYRIRLIRLLDLRVWFAAQEMVARRCQLDSGQVPVFTPHELHGLVGGQGGEHLRAAIRRLEAAGLLTWSTTQLTFATSPIDVRGLHDLSAFHTMYEAIPNHTRRVPVPRQVVRLIAGGCRPTVIATILGHLIRCLYYREHRCISGGWCKASWIADIFHMDLRNIKAARKHLVSIGWLQILDTPQVLCNRWGSYTLIQLSWTRAAMEHQANDTAHTPSCESPPPPDFCTSQLPPPHKEHREPLQELKHQEPAPQADAPTPSQPLEHTPPASSGPSSGVQKQVKEQSKKTTIQLPTLHHIVPEDLQDTARLLTLFEQAQTQGLTGKSDSERLTFLALAEHAKVVGSANPCGLFAALVRRQQWHFVTDSDEDVAQARLKAYLYGLVARAAPPPAVAPPELSPDAAIVRYVHTQLARAGWHGDGFGLVSRADPTWTRERWERAAAELAQVQAGWQHANVLNRVGDLMDVGDALDLLGVSAAEEDRLA